MHGPRAARRATAAQRRSEAARLACGLALLAGAVGAACDRAPAGESLESRPQLAAWERSERDRFELPGRQALLAQLFYQHGPFETFVGAGLDGARQLSTRSGRELELELGARDELRLELGPGERLYLPRSWFGDGAGIAVMHLEAEPGSQLALAWDAIEGEGIDRFRIPFRGPHDRPAVLFPAYRAVGDPWLERSAGSGLLVLHTLSVSRTDAVSFLAGYRTLSQ